MSLSALPPELIVNILLALDWRDLLRCKRINRYFNSVTEDTLLQYKLELAIAGIEDGPPSSLGPSERLKKLRAHQEAWLTLQYSSQKAVPMLQGKVWELYGGVLSQARRADVLSFRRLPSALRGIDEHEWAVQVDFPIRDFGIDPSQDLLVALEQPQPFSETIHVHLRTLSTGTPHPAGPSTALLVHTTNSSDHYAIQISGDFLGILFIGHEQFPDDCLIWNWKTGTLLQWITGREIGSISFLSDRHIILGVIDRLSNNTRQTVASEPELVVIDFLQPHPEKIDIWDMAFACTFHYPRLAPRALPLAFSIRSDPAPLWPSRDSQVPFYTARTDRLLVLTFWVAEADQIRTILLFTLASTILSHVNAVQDMARQRFSWEQWGPEGSCMMSNLFGHSSVWVCYVFGTRFVARGGPREIKVYDFNVLPYERRMAQSDVKGRGDGKRKACVFREGETFEGEVATALPYHMRSLSVEEDFEAVMVSEDSLITLTSLGRGRKYRIFTF
ncbi:uncharacterized protein FIBRA_07403 [Fibroporia radiculosa]|uniref:F-box domain-containing protein n=1 Tax=Fibroporia radiculosa TaxID=599839 RepID=J4H4L4_9APHY|nr:uncharacterized protein FIBRA_07403 [Fibroporia radiculosa]CCM05194.1 predicted protein [Fibroporia radiculosa]